MEDLAKIVASIISEYENTILTRLFDIIGKKNLVSVIITGSIARNKPSYKSIDGNFYLESDLDAVVVVNPRVVIKSLILIKRIADRLTFELRNKRLLSGVSLSIMTENALCNSTPTIFYQDLVLNGKVIFGKDLRKTLAVYDVNKIPSYDIYRLVFNRMVETLEVFASSGFIEKLSTNTIYSMLNSMEKLIFSLIQAILIKKNILIFRGFDLNEFQKQNFEPDDFAILKELLASHEELKKAKESPEKLSEDILRTYWSSIIAQFNSTIEALAHFDNIKPLQIKRLLCEHEKVGMRLKLCAILFLQYFGTDKNIDLFKTMVYSIRFGSDYVYFPLYYLFLSTEFLYGGEIHNMTIYKEIKASVRKLNNISSMKSWTKIFNKHFIIWKFING